MKKIVLALVLCSVMAGCSAAETFETVGDGVDLQAAAVQKQVLIELPEDAAVQTVHSDFGQLYFCDGYEVTVQTLAGGNLDKTLRELTGFDTETLTVITTGKTGNLRHELVWSAAGEGGDMVGRAVILDDGSYHYCMTAMAPDDNVPQLRETWNTLFNSFVIG